MHMLTSYELVYSYHIDFAAGISDKKDLYPFYEIPDQFQTGKLGFLGLLSKDLIIYYSLPLSHSSASLPYLGAQNGGVQSVEIY